MVENVEKAMAALPDDVKVIPGHGPLSHQGRREEVHRHAARLRRSRARRRASRAGPLEQMKQENVLAKYDALGQGFVKTADFIELIYNELAR